MTKIFILISTATLKSVENNSVNISKQNKYLKNNIQIFFQKPLRMNGNNQVELTGFSDIITYIKNLCQKYKNISTNKNLHQKISKTINYVGD